LLSCRHSYQGLIIRGTVAYVKLCYRPTHPPGQAAIYKEYFVRKPFILAWTVVERLPFLVIALLTLALAPAHATLLLWLFFALFAVSTVAGGASVAAWLDFVARVLPDDWRGRFFGLWSALGTLLGLIGGVATAALLRVRSVLSC
jgi:MFS family permease